MSNHIVTAKSETTVRFHTKPQLFGKISTIIFFMGFIGCLNLEAYGQASVSLYPKVLRIQKGSTKTITAAAFDNSNQPSYSALFNFAGSNDSVAGLSPVLVTGDSIGTPTAPPPNLRTVTGLQFGTTTITATWNGVSSDQATVIVDDPALAPTAVIRGDNDAAGGMSINTKVGEAIEVDAESSFGVMQSEWNWGDGDKTPDLLSATHAYLVAGTYSLSLKITNSGGRVAVTTVTVNVSNHPEPTRIINVTTIQELLDAYNSAVGGEHIVIPAGTILVGEIELPARNFSDYVTIRSSAAMPDIRDRVGPNEPGLVTLRGSYTNAVPLVIKNGASKIRLAGLKFDPKYLESSNGPSTYYLAQIGQAFSQTDISQNPSRIIVQHCVINPPDDVNVVHGLLNDGYKVSIISSWLGNIKTFGGQDSQAIASFDGRGAHVYHNNFLEASTENVMYGGVVPSIKGLTAANIEFRRCHFSKRLSWRVYDGESHRINVKNLFETKNARRLYVESSVLENHWDAYRSQYFSLVFKSATSPGSYGEFVPWAISEDIIFENNKISHVYGGVTNAIDNYDLGPFSGLKPGNIQIKNTLFDDLSTEWGVPGGGGRAKFLQPNNTEDIKIDHVTVIDKNYTVGASIYFVSNNNFRLKITNSIFGRGLYGIGGSGVGIGLRALNSGTGASSSECSALPGASWVMTQNVMPLYGGNTNCYPVEASDRNSYPDSYDTIGFIDMAAGNYKLSDASPYKNTASNGNDPGVNTGLLETRIACSVSGVTAACLGVSNGPPVPTPTPSPSPNPSPSPSPNPSPSPGPSPEPTPSVRSVLWENIQGTTSVFGSIQHSGTDFYGMAKSNQILGKASYFEWTHNASSAAVWVGLGNNNDEMPNTSFDDLSYAVSDGIIKEMGIYKASINLVDGDRIKIEITSKGGVNYRKNGEIVYRSRKRSLGNYYLVFKSRETIGNRIGNAEFGGNNFGVFRN